ncbi:MAG: twin-arginine translocase TatA/TatE family subunit [Desulfovibrio sp.]|jgi:sec-independent protein translocase protein TatB|nr:twin-arginine translocase TatA/TatE family subunit [Desulfovibrio sp.]
MLGISSYEFLVIVVVAVLVLGPEHLPRVIRTVTKVMSDFRRISMEFQRAINLDLPVPDSGHNRNRPPKTSASRPQNEDLPAEAAEPFHDGSAPELALAPESPEEIPPTAAPGPETGPAGAEKTPPLTAPEPSTGLGPPSASLPVQGDRP